MLKATGLGYFQISKDDPDHLMKDFELVTIEPILSKLEVAADELGKMNIGRLSEVCSAVHR